MAKHHKGRVYAILWLLLMAVVGMSYAVGQISLSTLVFSEVCVVALGFIAMTFWKKMNEPPETVEEILYRTEHPARS